jgi:hypothetical protein
MRTGAVRRLHFDGDESDFNMSRFQFKYFDSWDNAKAARLRR